MYMITETELVTLWKCRPGEEAKPVTSADKLLWDCCGILYVMAATDYADGETLARFAALKPLDADEMLERMTRPTWPPEATA